MTLITLPTSFALSRADSDRRTDVYFSTVPNTHCNSLPDTTIEPMRRSVLAKQTSRDTESGRASTTPFKNTYRTVVCDAENQRMRLNRAFDRC